MYKIEEIENGIKIYGLKDFNLEHIFECGQAFNWEKLGHHIAVLPSASL